MVAAPEQSLHIRTPADLAGRTGLTHCAFGTEFCEHLIPAPEAVRSAIDASAHLTFTLLTPYVTDAGIRRLRVLFDLMPRGEVVFNDWGVLNVLRRDYQHLTPIQGRLLFKSLRDPRVMGVYGANPGPPKTLASLQTSSLDAASCRALLRRFGVTRVEVDALPQGTDLAFAGDGIDVSMYVPFGFISTSRSCMAAGLHYVKANKFEPGAACRHECQSHLVEYTYTNSPFANRDQKIWLKGNTYFYEHTPAMNGAVLEHVRAGRISRIIEQPWLPMHWS